MNNFSFKKPLIWTMITAMLLSILPYAQIQAASKIKINKTHASLYVGKKITLKIKGSKKKVKWSSNKKRIATVNSKGRVTAKKAGKATITGKTASKKFRCRITVKKRPATKTDPKNSSAPTILPPPADIPSPAAVPSAKPTTPPVTPANPPATNVPSPPKTPIATSDTTPESPGSNPPAPSMPAWLPSDPPAMTPEPEQPGSSNPTELPANTATPIQTTLPGSPSAETLAYNAGEYSIQTIHSGEGTYYDRVSPGASNLDYLEAYYYTVAMNHEDYMNGLAGAFLEITDKDGDQIQAVVTDRLPEGKKGDIDFSRSAFSAIEPLVTGRMNITWRIIPFPTTEPISYVFKPTSSPYWAEVQIRNNRYPISKLEYLDPSTGQYIELPRQEYNYFTASSGMGDGPYTFRVTDFYGHVLIDTGIAINATETPVPGLANFPY